MEQRQQEVERLHLKLSNGKFVAHAPAEVVDKERAKLAEAESALIQLQQQYQQIQTL